MLKANECGKTFDNFTAPFCTNAKYIFLVGSGITYAAYKSHRSQTEELQIDISSDQPLGEFSEVGEILGWGGLSALYMLYQGSRGWIYKEDRAYENAELALEATVYTSLATLLAKTLIQKSRPDGSDNNSFPSGHTSSSFAWASVVMARHDWYYGLGAYLVSSYVAFSRINDDRHHFYDVYGGITLGASYAWGIYFNHQNYGKDFWVTALPTEKLDGASLNVTYRF